MRLLILTVFIVFKYFDTGMINAENLELKLCTNNFK